MYFLPLKQIAALFIAALFSQVLAAQHSIAREWNEALLKTMREDLARPHVQARNIFHFSVALYDAWAAYDEEADTYLLGKNVNGFSCPCKGVPKPADLEAARKEAMSFAAYRFLTARFAQSPQTTLTVNRCREVMQKLGYDFRNYSSDYTAGSPAALGNYIAQCVLQIGAQDGANEGSNYLDPHYRPLNQPLEVGAPSLVKGIDPNHWQPLKLKSVIGLDGYPVLECHCLGRSFSSLGTGHAVNPRTGQPYDSKLALRADYIRAAVQYWAEGPDEETPPGHWLALLNYVSDQPQLVKKFNGKGPLMSDLEWDVKACFTLGAALHDAAIAS